MGIFHVYIFKWLRRFTSWPWFLPVEGHRTCPRWDQTRHQNHLLSQRGSVRVPWGAPPEGFGQKTLRVHWLPHRALCGEEQGEGSHGQWRWGRGRREKGRRWWTKDWRGGRGEREGREEKKDQKGQGSVPRMGTTQQEQTFVDAQVWGRFGILFKGLRFFLQIWHCL